MSALSDLLARAAECTTDEERWWVVRDAWATYCDGGASAFDWDYDSRPLFSSLTGIVS